MRSWSAGLPARIWIVLGNLQCDLRGRKAEVLLVDNAVLVDHERHDARVAVSRRVGQQRKPAGHPTVDDIIAGAVRSLPGQDPQIVAIVGPGCRVWRARGVARGAGAGAQRPERALLLPVAVLSMTTQELATAALRDGLKIVSALQAAALTY
jgi:hypothetical protein